MLTLHPRTRLGRATLGLSGVSALLIALCRITGSASESKLSGWATFVTVVFTFCACWLSFRWARQVLHPTTKLGRTTLWFGGLSALLNRSALDHPLRVGIEAEWLGDVRSALFSHSAPYCLHSVGRCGISCGGCAID